jgi:hypothetical protein
MRASRVLRLIVHREGRGPAFFAAPDRMDHIEIVDLDDGEVVLFWDLPPREAGKFARRLRADMARLDRDEFLELWAEAASG